LQIFSLEVTLIRDQGWINVDACGPKSLERDELVVKNEDMSTMILVVESSWSK